MCKHLAVAAGVALLSSVLLLIVVLVASDSQSPVASPAVMTSLCSAVIALFALIGQAIEKKQNITYKYNFTGRRSGLAGAPNSTLQPLELS